LLQVERRDDEAESVTEPLRVQTRHNRFRFHRRPPLPLLLLLPDAASWNASLLLLQQRLPDAATRSA
jgi:hypothetical protein